MNRIINLFMRNLSPKEEGRRVKTIKVMKTTLLIFIPVIFIFSLTAITAGLTSNFWLINLTAFIGFVIYASMHVVTYDFFHFNKGFSKDELRVQMLLANASLMAIFAITGNKVATLSYWSNFDWAMSIFALILLLGIMAFKQKEDNGSFKEVFSKELFYESMSGILIATLLIILFAELYLLWKTYYVFLPLLSGIILFVTTTNDGIVSKEEKLKWDYVAGIFFFLCGVSIFFQIFFPKVKGFPFWLVLLSVLLTSIAFYLIFKALGKMGRGAIRKI